jgi:signal peptidase I
MSLQGWSQVKTLFGEKPKQALLRLCLILAGFYVLLHFVWMPTIIDGVSMAPTYQDGEFTVINRLAYLRATPKRGDIVAVRAQGEILLKRIIGLPGERFQIERGIVVVNGRPLYEPYVKRRVPWYVDPVRLGDDDYVIIGDNRGMAQGKHTFGVVDRDAVLGRTMF